jgi:hypothetical protein
LPADLLVHAAGGREVRSVRPIDILSDHGATLVVRSHARLQLEGSNIIRLPDQQTGFLQVSSRAELGADSQVDWENDSHWLGCFTDGVPLVLLRRAVFAEMHGVVHDSCVGVGEAPADRWRIALGVHDCFLDGSIPFRAGKCPLKHSPEFLLQALRALGDTASLRERMAREFGFVVDAADVRLSPTMFAGTALRTLLRQIATDASLNSELLAVSNKTPCWTQVGAYYRKGEAWPWEVTREVYFTFVDVSYHQLADLSKPL